MPTPRKSISLHIFAPEGYGDVHPDIILEDFLESPKSWDFEMVPNLQHLARVAGEALEEMLKSARPHPVENPSMSKAWIKGKAALSEIQRIKEL